MDFEIGNALADSVHYDWIVYVLQPGGTRPGCDRRRCGFPACLKGFTPRDSPMCQSSDSILGLSLWRVSVESSAWTFFLYPRSESSSYIGFTTEDTNDSVYRLIRSCRFDMMQICYNFIYQHPYEPSRPFGSILAAKEAGMGVVTMRSMTSGTLQKWIQMVNPENTFDYTPALLQFILSNKYVDVALVGMRDVDIVEQNVAIAEDLDGRISVEKLHERYV